jgi:ABC-type multidrug transport system ATPase subunit
LAVPASGHEKTYGAGKTTTMRVILGVDTARGEQRPEPIRVLSPEKQVLPRRAGFLDMSSPDR